MNQHWQEKKMRQLFLKLREQDERQAPPFASVLETALANRQPMKVGWSAWHRAAALALLVMVIGAIFFFIKPFSTRPTLDQGSAYPQAPDLPTDVAPAPPPSGNYAGVPQKPEPKNSQNQNPKKERSWYARHKPRPTHNLQPAMLISTWQSPTDGLLKTPGAELFKGMPQIGAPLIEMKRLFPEEKN